ncbi:hypothetical protein GCM10009801_02490 [Streptomyces albiaxialis]|uniref:Uncharacterized protein n=1 Tax=Streptomyces albiaxialis TaxID=329523 RepID=A0ABN2VGP6_9ACTN
MSANSQPSGPTGDSPRVPATGLVFDDPLSRRSEDDSDQGWGEGASGSRAGEGGAADLARFLDEKPPHHI